MKPNISEPPALPSTVIIIKAEAELLDVKPFPLLSNKQRFCSSGAKLIDLADTIEW